MSRFDLQVLLIVLFAGIPVGGTSAAEPPTKLDEFNASIEPFFARYCIGCHGEKQQRADFSLHNIDPLITNGKDVQRWEKALEMISNGDMPPENAKEFPRRSERRAVERWIAVELKKIDRGPDDSRLSRPEFGNRVDHYDLFSDEHRGPAFSPPRLWRKNSQVHRRFEIDNRFQQGSIPFNPLGGRGFQDYATLLANESTIKTLRINAKNYIAELIDGRLVEPKGPDGKPDKKGQKIREGKSRWREFNDFVHTDQPPAGEAFDKAVTRGFQLLLHRRPSAEELERYSRRFLTRAVEIAGPRDGLEEFADRSHPDTGIRLPAGNRFG